MGRKTSPQEDNWRNVEDARKRKQIQDRLAQRARRKRLREAKTNAKQAPGEAAETRAGSDTHTTERALVATAARFHQSPDTTAFCFPYGNTTEDTEDWLSLTSSSEDVDGVAPAYMPLSLNSQPVFAPTVFTAMFINGTILGLKCGVTIPSKSSPPSINVPPSLRPTALQTMTIHPQWFDRFPFPGVRDNLISACGFLDEEALMQDLFSVPSFHVKSGYEPWDPKGWSIERSFAEKWGFLFLR
ncbi:hypothetical protein P154DRAFT_346015 [Amniculicola lignicola CBS 123094]|uniref:BZIP domain-containing protein n=1 Tax=Amniculicola lignicola CBS 123094 TaxID=1392246 RepID=A0A6A5WCS6_9PLEO|nr:hypothetical protein P154DRAFT_346015 [Amniculicola lignicola CBS 123094]